MAAVGGGQCHRENPSGSARDAGRRGQGSAGGKKVKDEIKAKNGAWRPEARLEIHPSRARPPLRRGRLGAKYCTPLGDLSFSADQ